MRAEAIAVGLDSPCGLSGGLDQTASWDRLSGSASGLGLQLGSITFVRATEAELEESLRRAFERSFLIVVSGGRSTGFEDAAKKTIARVLGRRMMLSDELLSRFQAAYKNRQTPPPAALEKLALVPYGSRSFDGPEGIPAGFFIEHENQFLLYTPEIKDGLGSTLPEELKKLLTRGKWVRRWELTGIVRTCGLSEPVIKELLPDMPDNEYRHSVEGVDIKFRVHAETAEATRALLDKITGEVLKKIGQDCYGTGTDRMEDIVAKLLTDKGLTVATAESCTGGLLAKRLTDTPGSSSYMERGAVTYSNHAKEEMLGVDERTLREHGAVSKETAQAMAEGIRGSSKASIGL
ncbi:MAG TPA: nicotinamide-nucleotide amidohydrolase family protein, partial [Nitrospirota bacterium]